MNAFERRLRDARPGVPEPPADLEAKLLDVAARPARGPAGWRRGFPRSRGGRLITVALLTLAAGGGAIAAGVFDRGPGPSALPSEPVFPSAAVVDPAGITKARTQGEVRVYLAAGAGEQAGWLCLVRVAPNGTATGCSPRAAFDKGHAATAQDSRTGEIELWAWVPDGYVRASSVGVTDTAVNNIILMNLPRRAERVKVTGSAGTLVLDVPKALR